MSKENTLLGRADCKIVIFSDIHYAPEKPVENGSVIDRKLTEYSIPLVEKLTYKINNEINPDIVINLGDLVEDFFDHDMDIVNITYIWNLLKNKMSILFHSRESRFTFYE